MGSETKITRLTIDNFMRIHVAEIDPEGDVIELTGANGSGKSSALNALWSILRGKAVPGKPIKDGEDKATITMELNGGEIVARRLFTRKGQASGSITITSNGGPPLGSPQKIMDELIGNRCLDPIRFLDLDPKAQNDELKHIVGIDFSGLDTERDAVYQDRTLSNRDLKSLKARFDSMPPIPEDCPTEEIDPATIIADLEAAELQNASNDAVRSERDAIAREYKSQVNKIDSLEEEAEAIKRNLKEIELRISKEQDRIDEIKKDGKQIAKKIDSLEDIDTSEIKQRLASVDSLNRMARQKAEAEKLKAEINAKARETESLTRKIESIDSEKRRTLEQAEFPIRGLSIGDGEVLYNGIPLSQSSDGEKWLVATSIAMCGDPKLKVIMIRAGALLDKKTRKKIFEVAKDRGFQVWIETMDESGKVGIVFEDGRIKQEPSND